MSTPKLYGVPFSQPVRAVMWLFIMHKTPFELVLTNPGSKGENGSRHPDYLAKCPGGTIPCLEEPATGFTLGEAHAIMTYLARTHGWTDVYPDNEQDRAKIDGYLHYHHRNVREASLGLVAPKVRKDLDIPESFQESARRNLTNALRTIESSYLADNTFLMGGSVTLADIAAYVEIGQLRPEFTNVFDFSEFPNVQRWLGDMAKVSGHDEVHVVMSEMGDISQKAPEMDTIRDANITALKTLKATLASF
ncbi:MAG: glutathione S-transferase family protein [Pseudomonadales bacterium]|nr:glutathione S-transferase family protein [Pseudomonadales bacterium]MBO6658366.1 glutathione S-transferase family protein [Pseudomonadales bacterium]MBO6701318.1 glutathione S-transferase family protein [Pseudomonadales bacterium]MBO7006830.1 glutathione S-transferase family protein [Pseudomonadales bacterium]